MTRAVAGQLWAPVFGGGAAFSSSWYWDPKKKEGIPFKV